MLYSFYYTFFSILNRCDFNKYTIRVIKKMSQAKINEAEENVDDEMMLINNTINKDDEISNSDEFMSDIDDDTSEE